MHGTKVDRMFLARMFASTAFFGEKKAPSEKKMMPEIESDAILKPMDDFKTSIEVLLTSFTLWHKLQYNGLVTYKILTSAKTRSHFGTKFQPLVDTSQSKLIATGRYSKVYDKNYSAFKVIEIRKTISRHEIGEEDFDPEIDLHHRLRINIKELLFFYGFRDCRYLMTPRNSRIHMSHGKITLIEHEMARASCNLSHLIHSKHFIDYKSIAHYIKQICRGLLFLHQRNIVHGDLKPDNILCWSNHTVMITDFSLTTLLGVGKEIPTGTLYWRAPECIETKYATTNYTMASDLWSLGVIMMDCLQGDYLFQHAKNETDLLYLINEVTSRKINFPYQLLKSEDQFNHTNFKDLVEKLLVNDPMTRPNIAQVLNHAFLGDACSLREITGSHNPMSDVVARLAAQLQKQNASFELSVLQRWCDSVQQFVFHDVMCEDVLFESAMYQILELLKFDVFRF